MRNSKMLLCGLILGTSLVLFSDACSTVECKKESRLICEARKGGTFLLSNGFCYCCQLSAPKGEKGVCDKEYCGLKKMPIVTKDDCDPKYEVFTKKNVEQCRCQDKCEPIWEKAPDGEECGKALCAFKRICPQILCPIDGTYLRPDACHCCMHCGKKNQVTKY